MSKSKRKRRKPSHGSSPAAPDETRILAELDACVTELAGADPEAAGPIWGAVHKLLLKTSVDAHESARVIAMRDGDELSRLVRTLHGETVAAPATDEASAPTSPAADIPHDTLKKAMRAFRKRLKLTRLDHESRLGVGPMTSGRKAEVDAILPPHEFPPAVWEALAAEGQLRPMGQGFYMLGSEQ